MYYNSLANKLVMVSVAAFVVGIPAEAVSLFLTLIQVLMAIMNLMDYEEGDPMANWALMVSGTHGVDQDSGEIAEYFYKCRVGSNPTRSAIAGTALRDSPCFFNRFGKMRSVIYVLRRYMLRHLSHIGSGNFHYLFDFAI